MDPVSAGACVMGRDSPLPSLEPCRTPGVGDMFDSHSSAADNPGVRGIADFLLLGDLDSHTRHQAF